jgi:plasmid stabilization system protein ParE
MTLRVRVLPPAAQQLETCVRWWRHNRVAARDRVTTEFEAALRLITQAPNVGPIYLETDGVTVRRVPLKKTPYLVYYYVEGDCVFVAGVWSGMRKSGPPLKLR